MIYNGKEYRGSVRNGNKVRMISKDTADEEKGFIQDGRDGYIKEISISDSVVRWLKEDKLLYYRIKNDSSMLAPRF